MTLWSLSLDLLGLLRHVVLCQLFKIIIPIINNSCFNTLLRDLQQVIGAHLIVAYCFHQTDGDTSQLLALEMAIH